MPKIYEVTVSPKKIREDVGLLVHSALETHTRLQQLPQSLKHDIIVRLTNGADGM